ncbi:MAG TPA: hypothetical protein VGR60_07575 [Gemmatimonadales bacterium]|nr:hypothetical protein [Gemmatimonadales bacterium]
MIRNRIVACLLALATPLAAQTVTLQPTGTTAEFRGMVAVDTNVVWASGRGGVVIHTTDGGAHWQVDTIPGATGLFLTDVSAFDAREAWVVGTDFNGGRAAIYHTTDGGHTWQLQWALTDPKIFLDAVAFADPKHGLAVSDPIDGKATVFHTDDGTTWARIDPARFPAVEPGEASFAASGTALTVRGREAWFATGGGARARVFHSPDFTAPTPTWTVAETPLPANTTTGLFGVAFRDERHGIALGGDYQHPADSSANVVVTNDGGTTWTLTGRTLPIGVRYGVVFAPGTTTLLAPAPSGTGISTDDGAHWRVLDPASANTAACADESTCWLAGVGGRVAKVVLP